MTTTTASAGAAPAADALPASSAAPGANPAGPKPSFLDRVSRRVEDAQKGAPTQAKPITDTDAQRPRDGADPMKAEGEKPNADASEKADKDKPDSKTVPLRVMQQRIAEERGKADNLRKERDSAVLDAKKAREAVAILQQSLDELHKRYAEGVAFDPRDSENLALRVEQRGREIAAKLEKEHEEALRKHAQEVLAEQKREQLRSTYQQEIDGALSQFPLANRRDLIAELKAEARKARPASAATIAKVLHERALSEFQRVSGVQAEQMPPLPSTARPPGARSPTRFPNNAKGYEAFIESMQRG